MSLVVVGTISTKVIEEMCTKIGEPKTHFHIMRDVREMLETLKEHPTLDSKYSCVQNLNSKGQTSEYIIDRKLCLTLISGYSTVLRFGIIERLDRYEEEEKQSIKQKQLPQLIEENKEEAKALLKKEIKQELKQENEERAEKRRQKTMQPTLKQIEVSVGSPEEEETETIWIYGAEKPENRDEKDAALTVLFLASTNYLSAVGKCHEVGAKIPSEPIHYAFDKKLGYTKQIYLLAPLT